MRKSSLSSLLKLCKELSMWYVCYSVFSTLRFCSYGSRSVCVSVCYRANCYIPRIYVENWAPLGFSYCVQQSFPKLQLEVNVMVLENGGSGMSVYSLNFIASLQVHKIVNLQLLQHL